MHKDTKKNIDIALKLIKEDNYSEAEKMLIPLSKKNPSSYISYLLGYIHYYSMTPVFFGEDKKHDFVGSKEIAKRFLLESINYNEPIEDAFIKLANLEDANSHAIRILRQGLKHFPLSTGIYLMLISKSDDADIPALYQEIKDLKVEDNKIYLELYYFFFYRAKNYHNTIEVINKIDDTRPDMQRFLKLIHAFCLYELKKIDDAILIFQDLIESDIGHELNYSQYVGILLCFLEISDSAKILRVIDEIPCSFKKPYVYFGSGMNFSFERYADKALDKCILFLKGKKEYNSYYAKIRGGRALFKLTYEPASQQSIKDLIYAIKHVKDDKEFNIALAEAYMQVDDIVAGCEQDLKNLLNYSDYTSTLDLVGLSAAHARIAYDSFMRFTKSLIPSQKKKLKTFAASLIELLYDNKDYKEISDIVGALPEESLEESECIFEIAYSYGKLGNINQEKKYYEKLRENEDYSYALAFNLGLIYKKLGQFERAKDFFLKAIERNSDENDDSAIRQLAEINTTILKQERNIQRISKDEAAAIDNIKKENIYILEKVKSLIDAENEDHLIAASYSRLRGIIKCSEDKVTELIQGFLQKNYIFKVTDHNIDTKSNVYRISLPIREYVLSMYERIEKNKVLSSIGERINLDSFESLGFNEDLLSVLDSKIQDPSLNEVLKRDLKEIVFAILTESHKTALILSGSVIESLILRKISSLGISHAIPHALKSKNKEVLQMDLSELLYVADQNKIIDIQLYHFSQALKQYRNYIHPGVEIRKRGTTKIDEKEVNIAWIITKKLIFDI